MRYRTFWISAAALAWLALAAPPTLAAEPAPARAPVATAGLERDLLEDVHGGELHRFSLTGAALVAGGMSDAEALARAERALRRKLAACAAAAEGATDPVARGRLALALLHTQFLTGKYRPECTELQVTLETGDYNCVTATVLYLAMCQELGVKAMAVSTPGHVFARVAGPGNQEMQTTAAAGELANRQLAQSRFDRQGLQIEHGPQSIAANKPTEGTPWALEALHPEREISPVELLGKIYYNRAVAALEASDFATAVRSLRLALVLDAHDAAARENLLAALNNGALAQCDAGRFAAASEMLAEARELNAQWPPLLVNDVHVHQRWAAALCREGRYAEAVDLLVKCSERRPDVRVFAVAKEAIERTSLERAGR